MSLRISWLIPTPFESSGGHRNIFRAIRYLSEFGHEVTAYFDPGTRFKDERQLDDFLSTHFFELRAKTVKGLEKSMFDDCDALFATHYSTAYVARSNASCRRKFYFVQDFEPMFFPMGTDYLLAENTYRMGFIGITSGPWCTKLLRDRYGMQADYFLFPVDRNTYYPRAKQPRTNKRILFFARPEMPRRCYSLGVEALKIFHSMMPDVELVLYGSKHIDSAGVSFPHQNLGILPTLNDLASLYSNADAGVAFSTTNPSLVPYEMMACGLPVVDFDLNDSELHYGGKANACLVPPEPQALAEELVTLMQDSSRREEISERALEYVKRFPDEEQAARRIESLIVRGLAGEQSSNPLSTHLHTTQHQAQSHSAPFRQADKKTEILHRLADKNKLDIKVASLERQISELHRMVQMHNDVVLDYLHSTTLRALFFPARVVRKVIRKLR